MPTYNFINQATGDIEEHFMSMSELDDFKKTNPHLDQLVSAPLWAVCLSEINSLMDSKKSCLKSLRKILDRTSIVTARNLSMKSRQKKF